MSATREDAGMLAVARVRGAREQDSRIGLQQAAAEQRQREADVARLRADLERMAGVEDGPVADFVLRHTFVRAAAESVLAAETEAGTAARLTALARSHWQADKTRLSAVQMLLERRAEERRVERDRREARDLDEVVSQQWLRQRSRLPRDGRESA
jgi:flagellar export protein FliJ